MTTAIILFALTYVLMLTFSKYRTPVALASGIIFVITGMLPLDQVMPSLDFNVLLMIAGTMGLVALFIESKMPALLARLLAKLGGGNVFLMYTIIVWASVLISAFIDNIPYVSCLESSKPHITRITPG